MAIYHHSSLGVINFDLALKFYTQTFKTLSSTIVPVVKQFPAYKVRFCNFIDTTDGTCLCISDLQYMDTSPSQKLGSPEGHHICFYAPSTQAVDNWYKKALELGATSNDSYNTSGAPGPRPLYNNYYGAFVIDHNGYRLEACVKDYIRDQNLV